MNEDVTDGHIIMQQLKERLKEESRSSFQNILKAHLRCCVLFTDLTGALTPLPCTLFQLCLQHVREQE